MGSAPNLAPYKTVAAKLEGFFKKADQRFKVSVVREDGYRVSPTECLDIPVIKIMGPDGRYVLFDPVKDVDGQFMSVGLMADRVWTDCRMAGWFPG